MLERAEWTEDDQRRWREIRELQDAAEAGDGDARAKLRVAVREASPAIITRLGTYTSDYRRLLARSISAGNPLVEVAITERASLLAREVAGEDPTPLETLLAERVASLWLLVELMEAITSTHLTGETERRVFATHLPGMVKLQESVNRRYLAAIKTLAQVRKLQANTPRVQYNTQINVESKARY